MTDTNLKQDVLLPMTYQSNKDLEERPTSKPTHLTATRSPGEKGIPGLPSISTTICWVVLTLYEELLKTKQNKTQNFISH